jgi:hypothetical protein
MFLDDPDNPLAVEILQETAQPISQRAKRWWIRWMR